MTELALQKAATSHEQRRRLQAERENAQAELLAAEAELAQIQAAVNAFRMQCRLKIGHLVDDYLELRAHKQALWTRLQLLQQAEEFGIPYDPDDPFWHGRDDIPLHDDLPADADLPELGSPHDRAAEKRLYRELARRFHPDRAGNSIERAYMTAMMAAVNVAYQHQDVAALRDLADELDPTAVSELAALDGRDLRRLREQILKLQRRKRRARQQLAALQQENTTRLWRKAEQLEADGRVWWEEVRDDLTALIQRRRAEIGELETAVARFGEVVGNP
ncbi:MAG TPA: J domain-containing protein [Chloroflexota bacterium]|nr:J domain-containing protein [Chloroflexota bacterium]